jgi:hypothetical protein
MTVVNLEVLTNRTAVDETFLRSHRQVRKRRMRVMSTPTTVRFQIVVSSKDENEVITEKRYFVSLGLSVESDGQDVGIQFGPALAESSSQTETQTSLNQPLPTGIVMPPEDPPRLFTVIAN